MFFHLFSSLREGQCDWQLERWVIRHYLRVGGLLLGWASSWPGPGRGQVKGIADGHFGSVSDTVCRAVVTYPTCLT